MDVDVSEAGHLGGLFVRAEGEAGETGEEIPDEETYPESMDAGEGPKRMGS